MRTVEQKVRQSKVFLSEESFSLKELQDELGLKKESLQRALASLLRQDDIFTEYSLTRRVYRKASRHWLHRRRLAVYQPPLPARNTHLSPWLARERLDDFE